MVAEEEESSDEAAGDIAGDEGADITSLFGMPDVNLPGWGLNNVERGDGRAKVCGA